MKTLSGTAKVVIVVGLLTVGAMTLALFAQSTPKLTPSPTASPCVMPKPARDLVLVICNSHEYATTEAKFDEALGKISTSTGLGLYSIIKRDRDGAEKVMESKNVSLKTGQVTTRLVQSGSDDLTAIGAHVTQHVQSNNVADIKTVLDQLK